MLKIFYPMHSLLYMNLSLFFFWAGIEARGFIFGPPIALAIGAKFIPLRKPRKLPGISHPFNVTSCISNRGTNQGCNSLDSINSGKIMLRNWLLRFHKKT